MLNRQTDDTRPETAPAKVNANRENAQLSTGPKDSTSTRYNATKHGLLSEGVTQLDDPDALQVLLDRLAAQLAPVGELESFLVRRMALCMVRLQRACLLEAEFIRECLHPMVREENEAVKMLTGKILDPGLPASLKPGQVEHLAGVLQRYQTAIGNEVLRFMHELERLQRLRAGEHVLAPMALELGLHTDKNLASFGKEAWRNA